MKSGRGGGERIFPHPNPRDFCVPRREYYIFSVE